MRRSSPRGRGSRYPRARHDDAALPCEDGASGAGCYAKSLHGRARQPFGMSETLDLLVVGEARERCGDAGKAESGKRVWGVSAFSSLLVVIVRASDVGVYDRLAL